MSGNQNDEVRIIRDINDAFRKTGIGGRIMLTINVRELGEQSVKKILKSIGNFSDFNENDNPHGENDFGSIIYKGNMILWKIDYYDRNLEFGSPDPSDASLTTRVMTIMCADEY